MRERQPQEVHVVDRDDVDALDEGTLIGPVGVRELDTLGLAGGARGVDQRGETVTLDRPGPLLHGLRVVSQERLTLGPQVVHADDPVTVAGAVEHDDLLDVEFVLVRPDLLDLALVLGEEEACVGVPEDVGDVSVAGARVDGGRGASGEHDGHVRQDPVEPGVGRDRDPLLRLEAQREQAARQLLGVVVGLLPGQRSPTGVVGQRGPECLSVRGRADPVENHVRDGLGGLAQCLAPCRRVGHG